jgi:DNA invertase Pin-like site-specific DNA recombinase
MMAVSDKIRVTHLERKASVYIRQSSVVQVLEHRESTRRQYDLRQRAIDLGWDAARVEVVDEDLGQSGASTSGRGGFTRLAEEIAHGSVGAVLSLEVSRLARSSADWHRLLELCALADVVIADETAIYHPGDYNDRLLLGLKGQFADAELQWMRLRLAGAKLSKARRGELRQIPPTGFVWNDGGDLALDPDEEVQRAIALLFERWRIDASAYAVMRYFAEQGLRFPSRQYHRDGHSEIVWKPLSHARVRAVLRNPIYAGAYVYGRRQERMGLVDGQIRRRRLRELPMPEWLVCIRDAHPGYLSWSEYVEVQDKLRRNRTNQQWLDQRGAPREGAALLQGLALCGNCGRRMTVRYQDRRWLWYECRKHGMQVGDGKMCFSVAGQAIDRAVEQSFLRTMCPTEIELGLAVAREVDKQSSRVDQQWSMRLERARYDARKTEHRFKAVDPDNRLVARNLEREWNERLREIDELEREYEQVKTREHLVLTDEDRRRIVSLARDLPSVWRAATTMHADRKNLLRMVVQEISLSPVDIPKRATRVRVLWQTGALSEFLVSRPGQGECVMTPPQLVEAVRDLATQLRSDSQIAIELNGKGMRSGRCRALTPSSVAWIRWKYGIASPAHPVVPPAQPLPERREDGRYSVRGVAQEMGVTEHIVRYWQSCGLLEGERGRYRSWWFVLDDKSRERLNQAKARGYGARTGARTNSKPPSGRKVHCA